MRKLLIQHRIKLLVALISGGILFFAAWKLKSNWSAILSLSALLIGVFVTIILSLWIIWVVPKKQIAQLATAQADEEEKISELPAEVIALSDGIEALPESKAKTEPLQPKDLFALENEARKTLAQIVGGVVVIVGLVFTAANLWITQRETEQNRTVALEGQITDRYTKAIAQLGDPKLEVRLGGIYALERIAKDSPKDYLTIMEVLTAFVREKAPIKGSPSQTNLESLAKILHNKEPQTSKLATEIQAVLTIIARRTETMLNRENRMLDLHETDLQKATLYWAQISPSTKGDIARSLEVFLSERSRANFSYVNLSGANLNGANLVMANLDVADLKEANLSNADLRGAKLDWVDFKEASLNGANLSWTNLSTSKDLTWEQIDSAVIDEDTILRPEFEVKKQEKLARQRKLKESGSSPTPKP